MEKTYEVSEIFYSIQGEGIYTGTPALFVRFAGCNLRCSFCDTDHTRRFHITANNIIFQLHHLSPRCGHVVLTGGEPTMQVDSALLGKLRERGYLVHLETNGTIPVKDPQLYECITCSPKSLDNWVQRQGTELKLVYQGQDLEPYERESKFSYYYLQPVWGENPYATIKKAKENPRWRISVQAHKLLNVP